MAKLSTPAGRKEALIFWATTIRCGTLISWLLGESETFDTMWENPNLNRFLV
jgi:hypothetical protein